MIWAVLIPSHCLCNLALYGHHLYSNILSLTGDNLSSSIFETLTLYLIPMPTLLKQVYEYLEMIMCSQRSYDQYGWEKINSMNENFLWAFGRVEFVVYSSQCRLSILFKDMRVIGQMHILFEPWFQGEILFKTLVTYMDLVVFFFLFIFNISFLAWFPYVIWEWCFQWVS